MKDKKKILLYGIGTYKNRGVEAIINSTIEQIDQDKYDIYAATHDFEYNKDYYKDKIKKYIKHYKKGNELTEEEKQLEKKYQNMKFDYNNFELLYQSQVVKQLENSDICVSVGGDNYCYDYCTWLYALDHKAKQLGKKTVLWGASLFEEINDLELIDNLNCFDVLVIRESLSYHAIKKYIPEDKIIYQPDPAFSLKPKKITLNEWYKNKKVIALNLSPLTIKSKEQYHAINSFINYVLDETDYSICLLPHVLTEDCNDLDILLKIKEDYKNNDRIYLEENKYNCNELKYIISKCDILVAARTHASIAAYSTCVPTLVIGYSVKAKGIAKDLFGSFDNYVIPNEQLNDITLIEKFKYIESNKKQIKQHLEKIMPDIRYKSSQLFSEVLKKLNEQETSTICDKNSCIGCGICKEKCPKNAIVMKEDKEGFVYPHIDLKKCIGCNLCRKNCPIKSQKESNNKKFGTECYAAKNKDIDIQKESTSGGVFSIIADYALKQDGVVYGAYMNDCWGKLEHIRITNSKDLKKIRGSKYIQSDIQKIYEKLKKDVTENRLVVFCGTPCQVAAINKYLEKKYDNLITVSVICHGVMNDKIFHKYLKEIENEYDNKKIEYFKFRNKDHKWTQSSVKYSIDNIIKIKPFTDDALMNLYLKNLVLRPSCYQCHYKGKNNEADIILGDCWGIEIIDPSFMDQNGCSSVIINSIMGEKFIKKSELLKLTSNKKINISDIIKYNPSLVTSVNKDFSRYVIFDQINQSSIYFTSEYYNNFYKYTEMNNKNRELEDKIKYMTSENIQLRSDLNSIVNSKRWKLIDKSIRVVNKIARRK